MPYPKRGGKPMQGEQTSPRPGRPAFRSRSRTGKAVRANLPKARAEALNFWYGNQALKGIDLRSQSTCDRPHRSVGLRQEHLPALLQPDARSAARDPLPGLDHAAARRHQSGRRGRGSDRGADADRHGLPEAEPVSEDGVRERRHGLRLRGVRNRTDLAERVEGALQPRRSGTRSRTGCRIRRSRSRAARCSTSASPGHSRQPEILLFDEPTSALDPIATAKIEELIRSSAST